MSNLMTSKSWFCIFETAVIFTLQITIQVITNTILTGHNSTATH